MEREKNAGSEFGAEIKEGNDNTKGNIEKLNEVIRNKISYWFYEYKYSAKKEDKDEIRRDVLLKVLENIKNNLIKDEENLTKDKENIKFIEYLKNNKSITNGMVVNFIKETAKTKVVDFLKKIGRFAQKKECGYCAYLDSKKICRQQYYFKREIVIIKDESTRTSYIKNNDKKIDNENFEKKVKKTIFFCDGFSFMTRGGVELNDQLENGSNSEKVIVYDKSQMRTQLLNKFFENIDRKICAATKHSERDNLRVMKIIARRMQALYKNEDVNKTVRREIMLELNIDKHKYYYYERNVEKLLIEAAKDIGLDLKEIDIEVSQHENKK